MAASLGGKVSKVCAYQNGLLTTFSLAHKLNALLVFPCALQSTQNTPQLSQHGVRQLSHGQEQCCSYIPHQPPAPQLPQKLMLGKVTIKSLEETPGKSEGPDGALCIPGNTTPAGAPAAAATGCDTEAKNTLLKAPFPSLQVTQCWHITATFWVIQRHQQTQVWLGKKEY